MGAGGGPTLLLFTMYSAGMLLHVILLYHVMMTQVKQTILNHDCENIRETLGLQLDTILGPFPT